MDEKKSAGKGKTGQPSHKVKESRKQKDRPYASSKKQTQKKTLINKQCWLRGGGGGRNAPLSLRRGGLKGARKKVGGVGESKRKASEIGGPGILGDAIDSTNTLQEKITRDNMSRLVGGGGGGQKLGREVTRKALLNLWEKGEGKNKKRGGW